MTKTKKKQNFKKSKKSKKSTNKDKIVLVNFDVIVKKAVIIKKPTIKEDLHAEKYGFLDYYSIGKSLKEIPPQIIKHIKKNKKRITDHIFYDSYICCGVTVCERGIRKNCCPLCNKHYPVWPNPYKISFNSNTKVFTVEMIPPKKSNSHKDITKSIMYLAENINYGMAELGSKYTLYKIKKQYYSIDWEIKNIVIPDYYKK